jgi:hypothetical protein
MKDKDEELLKKYRDLKRRIAQLQHETDDDWLDRHPALVVLLFAVTLLGIVAGCAAIAAFLKWSGL